MPGAARVGDPISCGDTLENGSPNVFINSIAACRVGADLTTGHYVDLCYYPATPLSSGSPTVFINGIPVGRVGDPIVTHCCGPICHSGNISSGSPTVFVN